MAHMSVDESSDAVTESDDRRIVSTVDTTDSHDQFVIADISRDDQWLRIPDSEAPSLLAWR